MELRITIRWILIKLRLRIEYEADLPTSSEMVHDDFLAKIQLGNLARLSNIYRIGVPLLRKSKGL